MPQAIIALGANLPFGDVEPAAVLDAALIRLAERGVKVISRSRWWRSPAWPDPSGPAYVNGAATIETALDPPALLALLLETESEFGRERRADKKWASRTLDLDLIDQDGCVRSAEDGDPILPHPRAHERSFVLLPLREAAPGWRHPVSGLSVGQLIDALPAPALDGVKPLQESG